MGYVCPKCHKDFGFDYKALQRHFRENIECGIYAEILLENAKDYPYLKEEGDQNRHYCYNPKIRD